MQPHRIPFRPDGTDLGFVRLEPFLLELELVLSCCQHQLLNFPDIGNMDLFCSLRFLENLHSSYKLCRRDVRPEQ